jgi:hypothetical protein
VWERIPTVEQAPSLPGAPFTRSLLVRQAKAGKVGHMLPEESVHHRNGVKDDNRPENLELWTRPQPAGIRVTDAIAWAREILVRYAGYGDTSNNAHGLP